LLNIGVCIKPVPAAKDWERITIDPVTKSLVRQGVEMVMNPTDKHALELALTLKEEAGGKVMVFTMAPPLGKEALLEALAMGADEAYLLSDRVFAGADTLATVRVLAAAIKKSGPFDLILTGDKSYDGGTGHIAPQLGVMLGVPYLNNVIDFQYSEGGAVTLKSKAESGFYLWQGKLPLVLGITNKVNRPRFTTLRGVLAAKKKPLTVWSNEELGLDPATCGLPGSPTKPGDLFTPEFSRLGETITGDKATIAARILKIIRDSVS
jgi:electron transfer flavoprotein beta subunit